MSINLKIISWNVRGLNEREKRLYIKKLVERMEAKHHLFAGN